MYICKASPHPYFLLMVVKNHLLWGSLARTVERDDVHYHKEAALAVVRERRRHYTQYQWTSLACNPNPAFDLSFNQPCPCKGIVLYTAIKEWCNKCHLL